MAEAVAPRSCHPDAHRAARPVTPAIALAFDIEQKAEWSPFTAPRLGYGKS
jgi:hypothetical protein